MPALSPIEAVRWNPAGDAVRIIDQRLLPERHEERDLRTLEEVVAAIQSLSVRGAPAIGICAAMGLAVVTEQAVPNAAGFREAFQHAARTIREARPTAVNLAWAIDRLVARVAGVADRAAVVALLRDEATAILAEDRAMCRAIGEHGATLLGDGARVLTHCNAGALATGGIGTALAPVYVVHERGGRVAVIAGETRPLLQGSRLTAWELARAGIPVTVISDNMVGSVMRSGQVDLCLVGADRIAANGDVANKIGTYGIAVLAKFHGIPLYVAAPTSTIDPATSTGAAIAIEQRDPAEVSAPFGVRVAPGAAAIYNPAFDVTPAELVSGIITDRGIFRYPYAFR